MANQKIEKKYLRHIHYHDILLIVKTMFIQTLKHIISNVSYNRVNNLNPNRIVNKEPIQVCNDGTPLLKQSSLIPQGETTSVAPNGGNFVNINQEKIIPAKGNSSAEAIVVIPARGNGGSGNGGIIAKFNKEKIIPRGNGGSGNGGIICKLDSKNHQKLNLFKNIFPVSLTGGSGNGGIIVRMIKNVVNLFDRLDIRNFYSEIESK